LKVIIITNILNPYVSARFSQIANNKDITLQVLIQASTEPNRKWNFSDYKKLNFKCTLLPGFHLHLGRKDSFSFHFNYKIKRTLKQEAPDVVIVIGWNNPTSYFTARACKKLKIPLIAWSGSTFNEPSLFRKLGAPAIRWLHRRCAAFYAYGTAAKDLLTDHWGIAADKIFVLGNPINNAFFMKESTQFRKSKQYFHDVFKNKKTILFVGQLIERKGIMELIEAFTIIREHHNDAHLIIAGSGALDKKIKDHINQNNNSHIHLLGYVPQSNLPKLYAHSHILCLPSREEVWGLVVNEAMACGIPVVASDACGAAKDLLIHKKTGMVFKKGDKDDLADNLLFLLDKPKQYKQISKNSLEHIKKWDISKLEHVFRQGLLYCLKDKK